MKNFLIFSILFIAFLGMGIVETTQIPFPFIFIGCLVLLSFFKKEFIFPFVLIFTIMIDALNLAHFGITSLLVFATYGVIFAYEYYSGSDDPIVIFAIIFLSTLFYSKILSYSLVFVIGLFAIFALIYFAHNLFGKRNIKFLR